jgi:glycosyltransferase involved in cell wall biosynthesis
MVITDTPGHRPLIDDLARNAVVYKPGDVEALARGLKAWYEDRVALRAAKQASWRAAASRWHWEGHDREALLAAARRALG